MDRVHESRWTTLALGIGLSVLFAFGSVATAAAQQQPSGRYRIVLPKFEREGDVDDDFGEDLIDDLRELIEGLATHQPVENDEYEDALDRFDLDEDEMQCFQVRQVALQIEAELVMCGTYSQAQGESMSVSARFVSAQSGAEFEVAEFVAASHEEAAQQIFTEFERYVNQSRLVVFCWEDMGSQNYEDALDKCTRSLELNPQDVRALYGKARALFELGNTIRQAAIDDAVNNPGQARDTELPAEARGYFERSLEAHEAVFAVDELHEDALKTAGIAAAHLDRNEQARDYFEQYLELNPGDTQVRLTIARDLANAGDPVGALAIAEEGLQQDTAPSMTLVTYLGHFSLRAAQNMQGEAEGAGDEEEATGPDSATTAMFEKALGYYQQVFEEQGSEADPIMLRNIIATLSSLERYDQAAQMAEQIVAAKPDDAPIWSTYATVLNRNGDVDAAIAALDSVQALDPSYPGVWQRKGFWLMRSDRLDEARPALDSAIAKGEIASDGVAQQVFRYGYQKHQDGLPDQALDIFEIARGYAETPQTDAMTKFWTGFILLREGRQVAEPNTPESAEASLPMFQRALELFQESEPYTSTAQSINLQQFIGNAERFIEIQQLLLERG